MRQTRDLLLAGLSEKQIAEQCGLAKSTVNEYVAALHERYDVNSRAELMARFLRWRGTHRLDNSISLLRTCPKMAALTSQGQANDKQQRK
jgi:hypothetical protein